MDCEKTGALIRALRAEQGLTQAELAARLHLSDRTISKWECGAGCPDVALLPALAKMLGVEMRSLFAGELPANAADRGNMKKFKFYRCPLCGNILTATGEAAVGCCGKPLAALIARPADEMHAVTTQPVEDEHYLTFAHPMTKEHYLCFVAIVGYSRVVLERLYPEQTAAVRLPRVPGGTLYFYCSEHGLFYKK